MNDFIVKAAAFNKTAQADYAERERLQVCIRKAERCFPGDEWEKTDAEANEFSTKAAFWWRDLSEELKIKIHG